jgi:YHS domain-containing protein
VILRLILEAIVAVLVISALRSVIGIIAKVLFQSARPPEPAARRPSVPSGGELKKDPVCGTYISTATSIQKKVGAEVYYFCSSECRDKFRA